MQHDDSLRSTRFQNYILFQQQSFSQKLTDIASSWQNFGGNPSAACRSLAALQAKKKATKVIGDFGAALRRELVRPQNDHFDSGDLGWNLLRATPPYLNPPLYPTLTPPPPHPCIVTLLLWKKYTRCIILWVNVGIAAFEAGCILSRVYFRRGLCSITVIKAGCIIHMVHFKQGVFNEWFMLYKCNISRVHYIQGVL